MYNCFGYSMNSLRCISNSVISVNLKLFKKDTASIFSMRVILHLQQNAFHLSIYCTLNALRNCVTLLNFLLILCYRQCVGICVICILYF